MSKKRKINPAPANKEKIEADKKKLAEVLKAAGMGEADLLKLMNENTVMTRQCEIISNANANTSNRVKKTYNALLQKERDANIAYRRFDVELKELAVKELEFDAILKTKQQANQEVQLATLARAFDILRISNPDNGDAQSINMYLDKVWPKILVDLGLDKK